MDKSYVPCILTELRFLKSHMNILSPNRTYINYPKEDVITFLSRAIALIECLSGELESQEKRCDELVRDRDGVVEYWTKHCENLFHTHRKSLAAKDHEIWELQEIAEYWEDLAKKIADQNGCDITSCYPKTKINNPSNFCGNCRYCKIDPNEGIAVCTHSRVITYWLDPDAASCEYFESSQVDRDKPDHPCCEACNRDNCNGCALCPF